MKSGEKNLSERTLAFGNMTLTPRSMDKLPYHAPVTTNLPHPDRKGRFKKPKDVVEEATPGSPAQIKNYGRMYGETQQELKSLLSKVNAEKSKDANSPQYRNALYQYYSKQIEGLGFLDQLNKAQGKNVNLQTQMNQAKTRLEALKKAQAQAKQNTIKNVQGQTDKSIQAMQSQQKNNVANAQQDMKKKMGEYQMALRRWYEGGQKGPQPTPPGQVQPPAVQAPEQNLPKNFIQPMKLNERGININNMNKMNELRELVKSLIMELDTDHRRMKELWYVKRTNGGVLNISASKGKAEDFLWDKLKGDGEVFYVKVPLEDWESEMKVNVSNISDYARKLYREEVSLYSDEPKTVYAFIRGDEVYRVGNTEPLGMVVSLGDGNVMVKRHDDGKVVSMDPNGLYLGKDWHHYNK